MTTTITAVDSGNKIEHGVLIDLTLDGTTYYISNCYKNVVNPSNGETYQALAGFLSVSEIQSNISNANDEIQVTLSAIPPDYIAKTLDTQIKGGEINIYRVFFDYSTQEVLTSEIYRRFTGVISNYSVQEDVDTSGDLNVTHTITIIASSIMGVLENKISGRRTNKQDWSIPWTEIANYQVATTITGSNTLTFSAAHGFTADKEITFVGTTSNGLSNGRTYYVIATGLTSTQCQLSLTSGGSAITLTNGTSLTLKFHTDPSMDRVDTLFNSSFDFGKPYTSKAASNVKGGGGGGGGGQITDANAESFYNM